uniref:Uncharacterized protein n=1 Tax=Physcomitrium patens TaxID=3218 RepID=A0A2K1JHU9_PHYPA|nr:hypothetical protein PHYPA_018531 [Physcomitrium patens]
MRRYFCISRDSVISSGSEAPRWLTKAPTRGTTADDSAGNLRTLHGMIFGVPGIRESINLLESVFRNEDLKARLSC